MTPKCPLPLRKTPPPPAHQQNAFAPQLPGDSSHKQTTEHLQRSNNPQHKPTPRLNRPQPTPRLRRQCTNLRRKQPSAAPQILGVQSTAPVAGPRTNLRRKQPQPALHILGVPTTNPLKGPRTSLRRKQPSAAPQILGQRRYPPQMDPDFRSPAFLRRWQPQVTQLTQ